MGAAAAERVGRWRLTAVGRAQVQADARGDDKGQGRRAAPTNAAGMLLVAPQAYVQVQWEMPAGLLERKGAGSKPNQMSGGLAIALYRLGQASNDHAIVRKELRESGSVRKAGGGRLTGWVRFYAPKVRGTARTPS